MSLPTRAESFYEALIDKYLESKKTIIEVVHDIIDGKFTPGLIEDESFGDGYRLVFVDGSKIVITAKEDVWLYKS